MLFYKINTFPGFFFSLTDFYTVPPAVFYHLERAILGVDHTGGGNSEGAATRCPEQAEKLVSRPGAANVWTVKSADRGRRIIPRAMETASVMGSAGLDPVWLYNV